MSNQYTNLPESQTLTSTIKSLQDRGFAVTVADTLDDAKAKALALIPKGAEVLTMTSRTLEDTGIAAAINESGDYDAVHPKLSAMYGDPSKKREARKLGAAPDYAIGSVHAITHDGDILIASNTGSQLPGYAYGAGHVVWVVGAQKIVADLAAAQKRLHEHTIPLEDERALQAYGMHTSLNKELVVHREFPGRIDIVIIKQVVGF